MSKALKQFLKVQSTLQDNLPAGFFGRLDPDIMQKIVDDPTRAGIEYARFLENGARVRFESVILKIDRRVPFDAVAVLGPGWSIAEQDPIAIAIDGIDLTQVEFEAFAMDDGAKLTGDAGILQMRLKRRVLLDAAAWLAMCDSPDEKYMGKWRQDIRIYFDGTILEKDGRRYTLYLDWYRGFNGKPNWDYTPLENVRSPKWVSATLLTSE